MRALCCADAQRLPISALHYQPLQDQIRNLFHAFVQCMDVCVCLRAAVCCTADPTHVPLHCPYV
jgi:hypothetical protein